MQIADTFGRVIITLYSLAFPSGVAPWQPEIKSICFLRDLGGDAAF